MRRWLPVWLVARREIVTRSRSRAYRLSTVALVLLVVGGTVAAQSLPDFFEDEPRRLGVLPDAAGLGETVRDVAVAFGEEVVLVYLPADEGIARALEERNLDAVLVGPDRIAFESSADATLQAITARAAYEAALPERAAALGLTVEEARALTQPVPMDVEVVAPPETEPGEAYGLASMSTIVLLMAMSFYGQWVLVGVIEEKSNRVVEVLLAVLAPWQLLTGKVLGIMALAVLQIAATLGAVVVALVTIEDVTLPEAGATAIASAVLWLVLGLLLYNFVYAAIGSTASGPEDASSAVVPIMVPLMLGYFSALIYVPENPDALFSRVLSLFPFTAPLAMPARTVAGGGSPLEVGIAVAGMVAAIAGVIWLGSRIYTGAILQTQRVNVITAFRRARA